MWGTDGSELLAADVDFLCSFFLFFLLSAATHRMMRPIK